MNNRCDEITLAETRKKSRKSGNSDMLPGLALCAVRWIHSSIASRLHLLSEISHRVFQHVPRRREKHDFLVDPRQQATNRKRKTQSGSMLAADRSMKRDMSQLKIVVELSGEFRLASIVGWFFHHHIAMSR